MSDGRPLLQTGMHIQTAARLSPIAPKLFILKNTCDLNCVVLINQN